MKEPVVDSCKLLDITRTDPDLKWCIKFWTTHPTYKSRSDLHVWSPSHRVQKKMQENTAHGTIFVFVYLYQWLTNVHGIFSYRYKYTVFFWSVKRYYPSHAESLGFFLRGNSPLKVEAFNGDIGNLCTFGVWSWDWKIGTGKKKTPKPTCSVGLEHVTYMKGLKLMVNVPEDIPVPWRIWKNLSTNQFTNQLNTPPRVSHGTWSHDGFQVRNLLISRGWKLQVPAVKLQGCQLSLIQPLMQRLKLFVFFTPATISSIETISRNVFPLFRGAMVFHCWKDLFENGFVFATHDFCYDLKLS